MERFYEAADFANPENFRTPFDLDPKRERAAYENGLAVAGSASEVRISPTNTWLIRFRDGKTVEGKGRLGRAAYSADFLRGLIDGGARIVILRNERRGHSTFYLAAGRVFKVGI